MTDDINDKMGLELLEHVFFYGLTEEELEALSAEQVAWLNASPL